MPSIDPDMRQFVTLRVIERNLLRLKWHAAAVRFELALRRHDRALKYAYKTFDPNQPRVPAGQREGGQWTSGGGSAPRTRLAGDPPTDEPPAIPKERPPTSRLRSVALKAAARLLGPAATIAEIAQLGAWLRTYSAEIESYRDPPKSLEQLQREVSTPASGYDNHHIVEQTQAERDGFSRDVIDDPENLVRIPRLKHQEINGWYQRPNLDFDGLTPREYLSGRNWDVRRQVGLEALRIHGVLRR